MFLVFKGKEIEGICIIVKVNIKEGEFHMSSWDKVKEDVLIQCKRYCCLCEEYKGRDIEVHHIVQRADGGKDTFDNAIPLCFDCHSEVGSYNPTHPKGNRYKPGELKRIRDSFYKKVQNLRRRPLLTESDSKLLEELKNDYTAILEYCIRTDFASELVDIKLSDDITALHFEKWSRMRYIFQDKQIEDLKCRLLNTLEELQHYISPEFMRLHESSGRLIFKNQSWEEGCKLRDELRPNSKRIREDLSVLLKEMYQY